MMILYPTTLCVCVCVWGGGGGGGGWCVHAWVPVWMSENVMMMLEDWYCIILHIVMIF